mmetsp:Transcript_15837/g.26743  ORF Transcript_15837/g.26743 Transcript_15837/m.26743 type:complete len:497 (+) Transcript_15837:387-1877(+)|eukprot:CAMPEP_0198220614 /NCGR_PEP_ID=MMETSP1445-20131203/79892_1 /TAXON_ID=36898 /ORGANISM="Pyramimonas sp., Strain CCMP2087" /LENGTH=496 /DNA_ID=CAMNT_0043898451 /DNA_START=324 /DNA_END=1814 /DNA_ORIENTATION=+
MAAEFLAPRQDSYPRRDLAVLVGDGSMRASTLSGGIPFVSAEDSATYERLSSPGPKRLALKVPLPDTEFIVTGLPCSPANRGRDRAQRFPSALNSPTRTVRTSVSPGNFTRDKPSNWIGPQTPGCSGRLSAPIAGRPGGSPTKSQYEAGGMAYGRCSGEQWAPKAGSNGSWPPRPPTGTTSFTQHESTMSTPGSMGRPETVFSESNRFKTPVQGSRPYTVSTPGSRGQFPHEGRCSFSLPSMRGNNMYLSQPSLRAATAKWGVPPSPGKFSSNSVSQWMFEDTGTGEWYKDVQARNRKLVNLKKKTDDKKDRRINKLIVTQQMRDKERQSVAAAEQKMRKEVESNFRNLMEKEEIVVRKKLFGIAGASTNENSKELSEEDNIAQQDLMGKAHRRQTKPTDHKPQHIASRRQSLLHENDHLVIEDRMARRIGMKEDGSGTNRSRTGHPRGLDWVGPIRDDTKMAKQTTTKKTSIWVRPGRFKEVEAYSTVGNQNAFA